MQQHHLSEEYITLKFQYLMTIYCFREVENDCRHLQIPHVKRYLFPFNIYNLWNHMEIIILC